MQVHFFEFFRGYYTHCRKRLRFKGCPERRFADRSKRIEAVPLGKQPAQAFVVAVARGVADRA